MIEAAAVISTITGFSSFVNWVLKKNKQNDEDMRTALKSIYTAARETKAYLALRGSERNRYTEIALSKLWAEASVLATNFDTEWARIATLKDDYWQNPDDWTEREIQEAGIDLDDIIVKVKELLGIPVAR